MKRTMLLPVLLLAVCGAALADVGDPPARVARLNYMSGSVSFRPGSVEDWAAATPNYPMTTGDHLWADEGAGAEMHIGSTAVRLASSTAVEFLNLDDRVAQLSIKQGALNIRVRRLDDDQTFEVDTPNAAVSLLRPGEYRIDVSPDDATTYVTVRGGEANVTGVGNPFTMHAREMARISGDPATYDINAMRPPDGWDQWCLDRDRREDEAARASARYVPPEMVGYEDLGSYGVWREAPGYGMVWAPRVAVGWAPYHYGHWAWVEPWGWTWIDDAPWGFAPFHYGRWAFATGGWVWVPGAIVARPVYAPALVAFVGGPHFSLSVGIGGGGGVGVAWFPLGPREVYVPAYHVSPTYVQQVNITHVTNVTNITNVNVTNVRYVNQTVPGAVTAVPQNTFTSARPVAQSAVPVNSAMLARAQVIQSARVAPTRASVMGSTAPAVGVAHPPMAIQNRAVVARSTPPPPPVPFAARQQALQSDPGRPLDQSQINSLRPGTAAFHPAVRTVGQNGRPTPAMQPAQSQTPSGGGFTRPGNTPGNMPNMPARNTDRTVDRPAVIRPGVDRPAVVRPNPNPNTNTNTNEPGNAGQRPNFERSTPPNRLPNLDRPNVNRPQNVERPANTVPPRTNPDNSARPMERRTPAVDRPATPAEVRRENQPRQEERTVRQERQQEKKDNRKEEKKRVDQ